MKITLKSVKSHMGADGYTLNATICADGKAVGTVHNDGNGGSNIYYWNDAIKRNTIPALLQQIARDHATGWMREEIDSPYAELEDWGIQILLDWAEYTKLAKRNIVFKMSADDVEIYTSKLLPNHTIEAHRAFLLSRHPNCVVWDVVSQSWNKAAQA